MFGLFVHDKERGGWEITADNAGCYKIYRDGRGVGTSFLELVRDRRLAAGRADPAALVEFLAHGAVLGSRTFASGVEELLDDEILDLPPGGGPPRLRAKVLPKAVPAEKRIVLENFAGLARSLEGRSFSADATGGFDSRLIVCLLAENKVPMELAISGMPGTPDTEIAREMARLLDRPFHLSGHDLTDLDDQLVATFRDGDGQTDLRRFHRDRQNAQARLARGVEVFSHGGGGELFRDHYVIQDFPFYGSSRVNSRRYYDFRMTPVPLPPAALSPKGQDILAGLRPPPSPASRMLRATNNESYDRIYFYLRSPEFYGHYFSSYINMGLDVVAPLLDFDSALSAMSLSPWGRFFFAGTGARSPPSARSSLPCRRPRAFPRRASPCGCCGTLAVRRHPGATGREEGEPAPVRPRPVLHRRRLRGGRARLHGTAARVPPLRAGLERLEATASSPPAMPGRSCATSTSAASSRSACSSVASMASPDLSRGAEAPDETRRPWGPRGVGRLARRCARMLRRRLGPGPRHSGF